MTNFWICAFLGVVVAALPFLALSEAVLTGSMVVVGLAILLTSLWGMADNAEHHVHGLHKSL